MLIQDPLRDLDKAPVAQAAEAAQKGTEFFANLDSVAWIDWTAIVLLTVFFILGLFKGLLWQVSRIVTLVAAWCLSGLFGPDVEAWIAPWFTPGDAPPELPLYLAYVAIFIAAVVVLSLIAWLLQKLVDQSGMGFYNRTLGAVAGLGTGAAGVVVLLALTRMFGDPDWGVVRAAEESRSMAYSRDALRMLGETVPTKMREIFQLEPEGEPREETPR